jgi:hypothetical protein
MNIHDRLKKARQTRFKTATDAARALRGGSSSGTSTYLAHENGTTPPKRDDVIRYAEFFRVSPGWLLTGKGAMSGALPQIPVVGYVGAGAEVFPEDAHAKGAGLEMVSPMSDGEADCVALIIRGDSMHPMGDGWLIFYRREQDGVPDDCVNKLCVVKVHEGPTLIKELRRGRAPKLWTLQSWNAPPRENIRLDWAARVLDIRPR